MPGRKRGHNATAVVMGSGSAEEKASKARFHPENPSRSDQGLCKCRTELELTSDLTAMASSAARRGPLSWGTTTGAAVVVVFSSSAMAGTLGASRVAKLNKGGQYGRVDDEERKRR